MNFLITCPICGSNRIEQRFLYRDFYMCKNCDTLFRYPLPSEENIKVIYGKDYSKVNIIKKKTNQAETTPEIARQLFDIIVKELDGKAKNIKMLEFGAGLGDFCDVARNKVKDIIAVEKNRNAREFIYKKGIEAVSSITEIYGKNKFDLIVMIEVIEHLKEPVGILKRFHQLLKPDGKLFITTPNHRSLNSLLTREKWREILSPTHLYAFSPKSLYKVLSLSGFEKIKWLKKPVNFGRRGTFSIRIFISLLLQYTNFSGGLKFIAVK